MDELVVNFILPDGSLWETVVFPPESHAKIQQAAVALNMEIGEFILDSLMQAVEDFQFDQSKLL